MENAETFERAREYAESLSRPVKHVVRVGMTLDNYALSDRRHHDYSGYAVITTTADGTTPVLVIWPDNEFAAAGSVFVIDDGAKAVPHYVAGWAPKGGAVYLEPYPTNPDGRFTGWRLGPSRSYHVKVASVR